MLLEGGRALVSGLTVMEVSVGAGELGQRLGEVRVAEGRPFLDVGGAPEPKPQSVKSSGLFAKFRRRGEVEKTKDAT